MPVVSVILNSYNQADFLRDAVDSVLGQTYSDLELIVVDNGSTDTSQRILREYSGDVRVRLCLHDQNEPISRRFNEAVAAARGEFVSFLYSDDFYLPQKLERQLATFKGLSADYGVVYGPAYRQNQTTGRRWRVRRLVASGDIFSNLMLEWHRGEIDMITPLTRIICLRDHPFDEAIFAEGEAIFHHIALTYKFAYLSEPLAVIREHAHNAGKAMKRNREMCLASLRRLRRHPAVDPGRARLIGRYEAAAMRAYAWQGARLAPDVEWTRECLRMAFCARRPEALHPRFLGALLLTLLPGSARHRLNHIGHVLRHSPAHTVYLADYEGIDSIPDRVDG